MFEALENGIYRLCIPFENIYTSVFLLVEGENSALIDSGSTDVDSTNYILPALRHAGISPDYLICSHLHGDHCGGIRALCDAYPTAKVGLFSRDIPFQTGSIHLFSDGEILWERFQIFNMQGHTQDSLAALDLKTNTLLTADCLQLFGIGRYGTSVTDVAQYKLTIERIKHFGVQKIIAAHAYVPCGYMAEGVDAV